MSAPRVKYWRLLVEIVRVMGFISPPSNSGAGANLDRSSSAEPRRDRTGSGGWHPGVRAILALVVVLPILATGIFTTSGVVSGWSFRQHAQVVADDAKQLQTVAAARAEMNPLSVPLLAVSYAAQLGISEPDLDGLLKPAIPFRVQLAQGTSRISGYPTFSSTPALRSDVAELRALIPKVMANTVSFSVARNFMAEMSSSIDNIWYRDYNRLQADISAWQAPGSFEVHAAALYQTYQAFLTGGHEVEGAIYVLQGTGPAGAKQEMIQSAGGFGTATSEFAGHLSPMAQVAWHHIQNDPADVRFTGTVKQGLDVALNGLPPPFAGNLAFAGRSMSAGLHYLSDLNSLVIAASRDLHNTALALASSATHRLVGEILFLAVLIVISVGGVFIAGRVLTRPLNRLATTASQVHNGDFGVPPLPETGPREVVTTTAAFNDMSSTLKAVESTAVALAGEDLSHLERLSPLPGRTGRALQASVDTLLQRIHERAEPSAVARSGHSRPVDRAVESISSARSSHQRRKSAKGGWRNRCRLVHRSGRAETAQRHLWARGRRRGHLEHRIGADRGHRHVRRSWSSRWRRIFGRAVSRTQPPRQRGGRADTPQHVPTFDSRWQHVRYFGGECWRRLDPV